TRGETVSRKGQPRGLSRVTSNGHARCLGGRAVATLLLLPGKANHTAKEHRWRTTAGEGGGRPVVLKRWSVPTGEPCHTATVPHGAVGGRQKRSRETTSLAAYPISCLASASGSG